MHEITLLSTKALFAATASAVLAGADFVLAQVEMAPNALTQYGLPGVICCVLFYAIRVLHQINQKMQSDWMADRKAAEADRLSDRDKFFSKLEEHFESSLQTRTQLIESSKKQVAALTALTEEIKHCIKRQSP